MGVRRKLESAVPFVICYLLIAGQGAFRRAVGAGLPDYHKTSQSRKTPTELQPPLLPNGVLWGGLSPRRTPSRAKATLIPRRNDLGLTEKRPSSGGETTIVPWRSGTCRTEKRPVFAPGSSKTFLI
ncbi:unnamed protein product [Dicrocoelium dendriticum]|nr:unnamed protein product [Dicrocoelium dendriticum]